MSELKPYKMFWSKAYYSCGEVVVLATSPEAADDIMYENIGDFEGTANYYPDEDVIECEDELTELELAEWKGKVIK